MDAPKIPFKLLFWGKRFTSIRAIKIRVINIRSNIFEILEYSAFYEYSVNTLQLTFLLQYFLLRALQ